MIGLVKDRLDDAERAAIRDQHLGSMLFTATTTVGVDGVRAVTDAVQAEATDANTGRIGFLIAANQEGGLIQALRGKGFQRIPSPVEQGGMASSTLEQAAARWGRELVRAGVNLDLAPVADVVPAGTEDDNAPIGQLQREYGGDPVTVGTHVAAFIRGLADAGAATSAKHFPGLGRVAGNTDHVADVVDAVTTRDDAFVRPFGTAIRAGVPFVMVSLATYERIDPDHLAVFSPTIMGAMLRDDLGFGGVVLSDALGATAVASIPAGQRAIDYLRAGGDMLVVNQTPDAVAMAQALLARASQDDAFRRRVDESALRVLRAKEALGLLPCG
jgi:beta-N-acetylhexosaminidase